MHIDLQNIPVNFLCNARQFNMGNLQKSSVTFDLTVRFGTGRRYVAGRCSSLVVRGLQSTAQRNTSAEKRKIFQIGWAPMPGGIICRISISGTWREVIIFMSNRSLFPEEPIYFNTIWKSVSMMGMPSAEMRA